MDFKLNTKQEQQGTANVRGSSPGERCRGVKKSNLQLQSALSHPCHVTLLVICMLYFNTALMLLHFQIFFIRQDRPTASPKQVCKIAVVL